MRSSIFWTSPILAPTIDFPRNTAMLDHFPAARWIRLMSCQGEESQKRLVNLLRSFMFRRTHASRLFSLPIISLPDINERVVKVELCAAERKLYDAIKDVFIDNINGAEMIYHPDTSSII